MIDLENLHPLYLKFTSLYEKAYDADVGLYKINKNYGFLDIENRRKESINTIYESHFRMQDLMIDIMKAGDLGREDRMDYLQKMHEYLSLVNHFIEGIKRK
jgi:hypothetical protein